MLIKIDLLDLFYADSLLKRSKVGRDKTSNRNKVLNIKFQIKMIQKVGSRGDGKYCCIWLLDDIWAKEFVPKLAHQTVML